MPGPLEDRAEVAGFFGKLSAHGDFVHRRLGREFIDPWDEWLQRAMARSRECLGERWLELYLTGPLWRFALSAGVCGERPWLGLMMPSVDRVGRYFPLTIAVAVEPAANLFALLGSEQAWFEAAEQVALSSLDEDAGFSVERFDEHVRSLSLSAAADAPSAEPGEDSGAPGNVGWRVALAAAEAAAERYPALLAGFCAQRFGRYSLWCTDGSDAVPASLLMTEGLPSDTAFSALLDGLWEERGWAASSPGADANGAFAGDGSLSP